MWTFTKICTEISITLEENSFLWDNDYTNSLFKVEKTNCLEDTFYLTVLPNFTHSAIQDITFTTKTTIKINSGSVYGWYTLLCVCSVSHVCLPHILNLEIAPVVFMHPWSLCYSKALKLRPPLMPESDKWFYFWWLSFNVRP